MIDISFKVKYKIGEVLKRDTGLYKIIGYEFVKSRGIRYILLSAKNGSPEWIYLYAFEIDLLD